MLKARIAAALIAVSAGGLAFIAHHEGTKTAPYVDPVGVVTVCTGHTKTARLGQHKTKDECALLLKEDASEAGRAVASCVKAPVTQEQYDALVSLTFNVGGKKLCGSTLVRLFNAGQCKAAADQFLRWVYAGGRKFKGLERRRAEERAMFLKGCT